MAFAPTSKACNSQSGDKCEVKFSPIQACYTCLFAVLSSDMSKLSLALYWTHAPTHRPRASAAA
eukprot:3391235-Amphidinium_carterae.1